METPRENKTDTDTEAFSEFEDENSSKRKTKTYLTNAVIIILALLLILGLRHLLLRHFFPSTQGGEAIAKLSYLFNKVVHRQANKADFNKAAIDLNLVENDAIRTYANSHAEITFLEGGKINIDENTLIIIKGFRDEFLGLPSRYSLFLENGSISLNLEGGKKIQHVVQTKEKKLLLKGEQWDGKAEVGIQVEPNGKARITAYSGEGSIEVDGEEVKLEKNNYIIVDKNNPLKASLLPPSNILIRKNENPFVFIQKTGLEVTLDWDVLPQAKGYLIEISDNEAFQSPILNIETPNDYFTHRLSKTGRFYWRIKPKETNEDKWPVQGKYSVIFDDPKAWDDVIIDPQRNIVDDESEKTTIFFQSDYPLVTFHWQPVKRAWSYRLEVFQDPEFEEIILAQDTQQTNYSTKPGLFRDSDYFWQIVAMSKVGDPINVSDVFRLNLIYDHAIPSLTILKPKQNTALQSRKVNIRGVAPQEVKLFVNNQAFEIDARGKFIGEVSVPSGTSEVVFKVISENRIEYHARTVQAP